MAKYPRDLAKTVLAAITQRHGACLSLDLLTSLFENMYFASLRTEEGQPLVFNIVYLDPSGPDQDNPDRTASDRWSNLPIGKSITFTLANVTKLAAASDPRTSSLAVYHNSEGEIVVWGLIDQCNKYNDFVNYEVEAGSERPGLFQASIEGIGNIVAYIGDKKIAELCVNKLVITTMDVFGSGPIREALQPAIDAYLSQVKKTAEMKAFTDRTHWDKTLIDDWFATLCRLLLRIRSYRHGGAIIIVPAASMHGINIKYPLLYKRLRLALVSRGKHLIESTYASDQIINFIDRKEAIPVSLYLAEAFAREQLSEVRSEIDGALWFASLLSRVDGSILMTRHLTVRGFGVEIRSATPPDRVALCKSQEGGHCSLQKRDYNQFGTRHRSMMRYCWRYPDSVGFVVSQDGDIRVMTRVKDTLVYWENIQLQMHTFVPRQSNFKNERSRSCA